MSETPIANATEKENLHVRNRHRGRYDFKALTSSTPELTPFVTINKFNIESINFADPAAVKMLNRSLLRTYYDIDYWDIPAGYLCPPIPSRADYIHHAADLLGGDNRSIVPKGPSVKVLDIGTGANVVYPIIGNKEYGWSFVGTDIDAKAIESAKKIAAMNPNFGATFECRQQKNSMLMFDGIIKPEEEFELVICNPPFHSNGDDAEEQMHRKWKNLGKLQSERGVKNFGGQNAELLFPGGEEAFVSKMVAESAAIAKQCYWFTSLVAKTEHMHAIHRALKKVETTRVRTIPMSQGQKTSRVIAWSFLNEAQQKEWRERKFWD